MLLAFGLLRAAPLPAQQAGAGAAKPEEQINVTADSLQMSDKGTEIQGQGNVEVKRQEMTLKADQVWMNRETNDMEAAGHVTMDDPEWKIKSADRLRFNLGAEVGTIDNGDVFLEKGHLSLTGRRIEKLSGQAYHIDDGFFTTCLCESGPPSWKISAEEMDISREGTGKIRRATFYILDVPVLYLPYALFPVKSERQTGFLFPEFGVSSKSGFRYMQPFYWAISKSSDATITFDIETRARVGFLGEYRQIFSRDANFQIDFSYLNEAFRDNPDASIKDRTIAECKRSKFGGGVDCDVIPLNRGSIIANHRQTDSSGWTTYSDIRLFSDDFFTRELARTLHFTYDQERDIKTSRYSLSRAGFFRSWGEANLRGEWDFYQDFIQADKRTLQRTPQLATNGRSALWNTPLEFRWQAAGVNYLRQEGADGLRLDLRPELVLPFHMANYLYGSFSVAPRETAYHLYDTNDSPLLVTCALPFPAFCNRVERHFARNSSRELVEVNGNVGTSFGRVYSWDGADLQKIRHVVEPQVSYLFISRSRQSDIPIMDGIDRVNHRNMLTFSLTNRFWGKFSQSGAALPEDPDVEPVVALTSGDTRELGRLKFEISYDMEHERTVGDRLSDLDISLRVTPKDYLALAIGTGVSPNSGQLNQAQALFSILDPRPITRRVLDVDFMRPNSLDLTYRFIGKNADAPLAENANLLLVTHSPKFCIGGDVNFDPRCKVEKEVMGLFGVRSLLHLTDHLLFLYEANYNTKKGGFTTNRGAVKLLSQCECWTVTASVNRTTNPDETNFKFSFELLGLSSQAKQIFK
ncbi:MAG TPA: LPS assembly protein LptD [Candidatus Binatia bacterium]